MTTTRDLVILALALAVGPAPVTAAEPDPGDPEPAHFCADPATNREWAELLAQNPEDRIVVALSETIRLMAEIDEVIDQYGGWPRAFSS